MSKQSYPACRLCWAGGSGLCSILLCRVCCILVTPSVLYASHAKLDVERVPDTGWTRLEVCGFSRVNYSDITTLDFGEKAVLMSGTLVALCCCSGGVDTHSQREMRRGRAGRTGRRKKMCGLETQHPNFNAGKGRACNPLALLYLAAILALQDSNVGPRRSPTAAPSQHHTRRRTAPAE
eukprot:2324340-Rhodomonas_salina.2